MAYHSYPVSWGEMDMDTLEDVYYNDVNLGIIDLIRLNPIRLIPIPLQKYFWCESIIYLLQNVKGNDTDLFVFLICLTLCILE